MILEFVDILGLIKNDTEIDGKGIIFNIITESKTFNCILFVHPTENAFVSLLEEDLEYKEEVLKLIFDTYTLEQLLKA